MAYESKVYIVDVHRHERGYVYAEKIAEVNLCKMGYDSGWKELFAKDIDYMLLADDGNTEFDTDLYGEHMKSCSVNKVIEWLESEMQHNNYRRLPILYGLLKSFDLERWSNLEVVHFGY